MVTLKLEDEVRFQEEFGFDPRDADGETFRSNFLETGPHVDQALRNIIVTPDVCGDTIAIGVRAEIVDEDALLRGAREAYRRCWADADWKPLSADHAAFEMLLASNGRPSPCDCGYEISGCHGGFHPAPSPEPQMEILYGFYVNLDEREAFFADVRDRAGNTVFELRSGDDGRIDLVEDGFMRHGRDIGGLRTYLVGTGVIPGTAELLAMESFEARLEDGAPEI